MENEKIDEKKQLMRQYYREHREHIYEMNKQWRRRNRDVVKEYAKKNREKNPDYSKKYWAEHKDEINARRREKARQRARLMRLLK